MMSEAQINKKFLTYENPTLGFRMVYPSGLKIIEENPGSYIHLIAEYGNKDNHK